MRKNNARSLKIPSASWIRNVIREEVKAQLEESNTETRGPRHELTERPQRNEFMDGPMNEGDGWDVWWDGPRPSDRTERAERPNSRRRERSSDESYTQGSERPEWNIWDGEWMANSMLNDPIMEAPRNKKEEKEIEASISPLEEKPKARRRQRVTEKRR